MVRSLARVYYYFVFNAMLILAAVGLGLLLAQALRYTPLNTGSAPPTTVELTQALSFAGVFWLIAGALGGAHYLLLRRDLAADRRAGSGGVRSFFLNGLEFAAGWVGLGFAATALSGVSITPPPTDNSVYWQPVVLYLSVATAAYFVMIVVELERRRSQPGPGAPIVFQRLHLYAMQFVALGYVVQTLTSALGLALRTTVFASAFNTCGPVGLGGGSHCPDLNVFGPWLAAAFSIVMFGVYWLLSRRDTGSALRQVQQLLGLAVGGFMATFAADSLLTLALGIALGAPTSGEVVPTQISGVLPPLLVGLVIVAVYALWLRSERGVSRMGAETTVRATEAVAAVAPAVFFWVGVFQVVWRFIEILTNSTFQTTEYAWAGPVATLLIGVAYIPISLYLRARTRASGATGPRRAFVLGLLAAGTLTGAFGAATALVTTVTAALGAPIDHSGEATRFGAALLLTGLALAALYGWSLASERLIGRGAGSGAATEGQVAGEVEGQGRAESEPTVEALLDELLAGQLSRDEAATRVRVAARAGR